MDRRDFIKASAGLLASVSATGAVAQDVVAGAIISGEKFSDGKPGDVSNAVSDHLKVDGYVKEPAHRIPVVASADIVVVGGGPGGVAAAVSAAREGASVILIEKSSFLGGLWTGGLVLPVLATYGRNKAGEWSKATGGICAELCDVLLAKGWAFNAESPRVDPEATKYLLDKTILDAGVRVLYNASAIGVTMSGSRIDSVLLNCNTGRLAIKCKMAVDASGDGCLFNWTGDPYESRRYHISTSYLMGGCKGKKIGSRTPNEDMRFSTIGTRSPEDGLDVFRVSSLLQKHRLDLWDRIEKLREDPVTKDVYLMEVAPTVGIRVTRVLNSLHNVTLEESMEWTAFDDVIGMSGICDPFEYKGRRITKKDRPIWQIPYRSLLPQQTSNLLVCGRCFGYDQGITWDAREISTCMVTGQAAGTAAALSTAYRCASKELEVKKLQQKLREAKVRLDF